MPRKFSTYLFLFLSFFLLVGGILILFENEISILKLQYLEEKMFKLNIDDHFFKSLLLYFSFIILICFYFYFTKRNIKIKPISKSKVKYIIAYCLSWFLLLISLGLYLQEINAFISGGESLYLTIRFSESSKLKLFQYLIRFSLAFCLLALINTESASQKFRNALLVVALLGWCLLIGNRMELLLFMLSSFFYFFYGSGIRINKKKAIGYILISLLILNIIESSRFLFLSHNVDNFEFYNIFFNFINIFSILSSTETIASFISLYGILAYDVQLNFLEVFDVFTFNTFGIGKNIDSYGYYSSYLGLMNGQGYSFNILSCGIMLFGEIIGFFFSVFFVIGVFEFGFSIIKKYFKMNGFILSYFYALNLLWGRMTFESLKVVYVEGIIIPAMALFILITIYNLYYVRISR